MLNPFWMPFGAKRAKENDGTHYADVMPRAFAACIDLMVIYILFFRLFMSIKQWLYGYVDAALLEAATREPSVAEAMPLYLQSGIFQQWLLFCVIQLLIIGAFLVSVQCIWQATPGKWLLGLKVVKRGTLETPEAWRYILRFFAYIPAALPLTLGIIWAGFNREHRGWHDMIAGTVVIHTRPQGWYWQQVKRLLRGMRA